MELRASELARAIGATLDGDGDLLLHGVAPLDQAGPGDVSFLANPRYRQEAETSGAGALIVATGEQALRAPVLLRASNPYLAFARALQAFHPAALSEGRVSPRAVVGEDVVLGDGAIVEPLAVLGDGCRIGARTRILSGAVLGRGVVVGEDCVIHPHVTLYDGVRVGARVILHAGAVVGSDGFGFAKEGRTYHKIPQVGTVVIEDDVEIGANATVDRATLGKTVIGAGTKIDNLVQVAHNVRIGAGSALAAQVGIAGSATLGEGATMGGQSGVSGHLSLGRNVTIAGKSAVFKDLADGAFVSGVPARPIRDWQRGQAALGRLEALRARVARLEKALPRPASGPAGDQPSEDGA